MLFKYLLVFIITAIVTLEAASASDSALTSDDEILRVIEGPYAPRITNVGVNPVLYPDAKLPMACCIHPYNPDFHNFLVAIKFKNSNFSKVPPSVASVLTGHESRANLYLNIQDAPWNPADHSLVRPHALFDSMGNIAGHIRVFNDVGREILNEKGSIHSHDGIASPSNFAIPGLDVRSVNSLWSIVDCPLGIVVTRHILLPTENAEIFINTFFDRVKVDGEPECHVLARGLRGGLSASLFAPFLTEKWQEYLKEFSVK